MTAFLILDDIHDNSEIRRGKTCWHKVKGMEKIALTDMLMLENGCHLILNRAFGHLPCHNGMRKTITETFMVALMGHSLEYQFNKMGMEHFTIENFNNTKSMIGSYYRFYMPAALTMLLTG